MPLNSRGSVSARLSVWLSDRSRIAKVSLVAARTSIPPRSSPRSAASPRTRRMAALRLVPASASTSVPPGKPKLARGIPPPPPAPRAGPSHPARDHDMDGEEHPVPEAQHDPLPEPAEPGDGAALRLGNRRLHGAENECASEGDPLHRPAENPPLQRRSE